MMGGKFCALKFKRHLTPLNMGSTSYAGLRRQDQRYNINPATVNVDSCHGMTLLALGGLIRLEFFLENGHTGLTPSNPRAVRNRMLAVVSYPVNYPRLLNSEPGSPGSQE